MNEKNSAYWRNEIAAGSCDSKKLWNVFHAVLGETRTDDTGPHTAEEFAVFFRYKIDYVRASTRTLDLCLTCRTENMRYRNFAPIDTLKNQARRVLSHGEIRFSISLP